MSEFQTLYGQFIDKYRHDLVSYARDFHNHEFDRQQLPIAMHIQSGARYTNVKSGHGVGKTRSLSVVVSWFCNTRYPWRVVMTAPTSKQLWDALWPETRARFGELPGFLKQNFEIMAERIVLREDPDNAFISPRTTSKEHPEALQGIHSENVLIIADEAPGIPDEVFIAGQGSMSGENAQTVLTGNPSRRTGYYARTFLDPALSAMWPRFTINAELSPWVARKAIEDIITLFGKPSNEYNIRILGEFPETDDQSFIARQLVLDAMGRAIIAPPVRPIWGLDPARFGRDKSAFCERHGPVTSMFDSWHGMDTMHSVGYLLDRYRKCFPGEEPSQILIDVIGIGAGIVDRGIELGLPIVGINVAETPPMGAQGYRLRDELWARGRAELYARRCVLPARDPDIADQLSQPTYEYRSDGRIQIESKESMKKRGLSSPDKADSWLLTYAGDAAVLIGQDVSKWGKTLPNRMRVT